MKDIMMDAGYGGEPGRVREREKKRRLREETASWQWGVLGLFVLSLAVNIGMMARVNQMDAGLMAAAEHIQQVREDRDRAVERLGAEVLQSRREAQARAEQAAAYEAVGAYRYIGECTVTYYCPCEECCGRWADGLTATGVPASPGIVAVDKSIIPLGSTVVINGARYLAADTGVTGNHVDICAGSHEQAEAAGVRTAEVWVVEP